MGHMGAMGSMKTFNKPTRGGEDFKDCYTKVIHAQTCSFSIHATYPQVHVCILLARGASYTLLRSNLVLRRSGSINAHQLLCGTDGMISALPTKQSSSLHQRRSFLP